MPPTSRVPSPSLVVQLVAETEQLAVTLPFRKAVRWWSLLRMFAAA